MKKDISAKNITCNSARFYRALTCSAQADKGDHQDYECVDA